MAATLSSAASFLAALASTWALLGSSATSLQLTIAPWIQTPSFTVEPTQEALARVPGAEVKVRLISTAADVASCPWTEVVAGVQKFAHRVVEERVIQPVLRVRAPEVSAAPSLEEKVAAYWGTLADPPSEEQQALALSLLEQLDDPTALLAQIQAAAPR